MPENGVDGVNGPHARQSFLGAQRFDTVFVIHLHHVMVVDFAKVLLLKQGNVVDQYLVLGITFLVIEKIKSNLTMELM